MNVLTTKGGEHMEEALKYLQAGAIVPVDMETTILLVNALKEVLAQPEQELNEAAIRADEREACALIVEDMNSLMSPEIAKAIRARGNT
jgi:hypothetical protein